MAAAHVGPGIEARIADESNAINQRPYPDRKAHYLTFDLGRIQNLFINDYCKNERDLSRVVHISRLNLCVNRECSLLLAAPRFSVSLQENRERERGKRTITLRSS